MNSLPPDASALPTRAAEVADMLRVIGNTHRLLVLCHLVEHGELTASQLVALSGLSQSALSQHLARLRDASLIAFRRDAQTLWYRIADPRAATLLGTLHQLYCQD